MSKTILVPIDYSDVANNALKYAAGLAGHLSAKIILLHIYHVPVPTGEIPILIISPQELEKENRQRIKKLEKEVVKLTSGKVKVESIAQEGFAVDEILEVIKEKKINLVVMGITGAGNTKSNLWGSTTTSVMKKSQCPVLVIPKSVKFKKPKKIVLAYDFNGEVTARVKNSVKSLVKALKAEVLVFDMLLPEEIHYKEALAGMHADNVFTRERHSMNFREGENINLEIAQFADEKSADWLIMIPHKYNFWNSLFHRSNTRQMAFETKVPLLSVHD